MFKYIKAIVEKPNSSDLWMEENLAYADVTTLLTYHKDVYVQINNIITNMDYWFNLRDLELEINQVQSGITLSAWIMARGTQSFPYIDSPPQKSIGVVRYNDAYVAGWSIDSVHPSGNDVATMSAEYSDILLARTDTDYDDALKHMLVTVNGFTHLTFRVANGILVKGGSASVMRSGENNVGLLSFKDVGEIELITLREDELYNPHAGGALIDEVWITMNRDIGNRVPRLSLAGHMLWAEDVVEIVGINTLKININKLNLPDMFFQVRKYMNTDSVDSVLFRDPSNPDNLRLQDLNSDDFVKKLFTMDQSFIVLVDRPNLHVEKTKLEYTALPGRYYCNQLPIGPIETTMGRMPEYRAFPEDVRMVIALQDNFTYRSMHETYEWRKEIAVDNQHISSAPRYYSQGHLLNIFTVLN